MSSTWVMDTEGLLHRDPVIRGRLASGADWFVCFDAQEPPEMVVSQHNRVLTDQQALAEAVGILELIGWQAAVVMGPARCTRCFGSDAAVGPYHRACSFFLALAEPIPSHLLSGRGHVQPQGAGSLIYAMGRSWG